MWELFNLFDYILSFTEFICWIYCFLYIKEVWSIWQIYFHLTVSILSFFVIIFAKRQKYRQKGMAWLF